MKKATKKKIIIYSAVVLVIVAIVLINKAVKNHKSLMAQFDVTPSTAVATTEDIGIYVPASGTISSGNTETVFADTVGTVVETYYSEGDFVNAGDVIAVVEGDTLEDQIEELKNSIYSQRSSIDEYENEEEEYTIKSPVYGRVKEINVKYVTSSTSEYYRERAEDIEDEYGYLVSIAVGNSMYIKVTEDIDKYEVGMEVDSIIHQDSGDVRVYSGSYVEKIIDDTVYIYVNTSKYDDDAEATIYTSDGKTEIGTGITAYKDMEYVVGAKGYIKITSTFTNQLVNEGDILYYSYSKISQSLSDMYAELESLEEELADLQTQYANLQITAPVSGFIETMDVALGDSITADTAVCTVADTSIWVATVDVDELDVNTIEVGMNATVTIDAMPDEEFEGTVKRISSVGTNTSGVTTYTVEIEVPSDERFKLSMNASSEIEVQKVENVVSVPIQAVRYQGDNAYVLVYVEHTDDELQAIKKEILEAQETAEDMAKMSQEELQEYMSEMREESGDTQLERTEGEMPEGEMPEGGMPAGGQNMQNMTVNTSSLTIAEQMYGEVVFVEVGIQDETNIEIISGLEAGDIVLLTTTETDSSSSDDDDRSGDMGGMSGFNSFGGGMGGGMGGGPG